jgi:hypothetical protein
MKTLTLLIILTCTALSVIHAQQSPDNEDYILFNRSIEQLQADGKKIVRFSEASGAGIAWARDLAFSEGAIEFDARGRDVLQKSFIGIAFHGIDDTTYETVYFRPFNFLSTDPARKIHAVQYSFEPKFGFQQLRESQKDKFETAIKPANISPSDWFHVKIVVKRGKIQVFINGTNEACMEVASLNPEPKGKKIGFWVGNNSNGDFANLKLSK